MSNKIGRFEIQTEITHTEIGSVYKATDEVSGQTVALKTVKLDQLGAQAATLVASVHEEVASSKVLNSHNIAVLYGAEEIEGQLCASMEYVQGNSIATMMARKEGFSVWDLMDIARQSCQGLDHARGHRAVHHSLEPAKIMVQWDGIVKLLGYGTSMMGSLAVHAAGNPPEVLHYMSPEQLRGDPLDARSNLFSLGAILYEMVTERKAFDGDEADQVRQSISEMTPPPPDQINRKAHPVLSQVIMKALAKNPEERYQSGQDMVNDLERCKESPVKATAAVKPAPPAPKAAAPQKYAAAGNGRAASAELPVVKVAVSPRVAAAAAGAGAGGATAASPRKQKASESEASEAPVVSLVRAEPLKMSSAAAPAPAPESAEADTSSVAHDPMMDESRTTNDQAGRSFSEINELPPMKEVYVAPPPPPSAELTAEDGDAVKAAVFKNAAPEKPKVQPREVARKAVTEIKKTPPKLFFYSIAGAVGIILIIVVGIAFHIHSENSEEDGVPAQSTAATPVQPAPAVQATVAAPLAQPVAPEPVTTEPPVVSVKSVKPKYAAKTKGKSKTPPPAAMIVPGVLNVSSTPEGAQVSIDGRNDPAWATPYNMAGLMPGQHTITVTKPGYSSETRNVEVSSGSKSFLVVQLAQLAATLSAASTPAGAAIFIDGKDTGKITPAQFAVDKAGNHSFTFKKQGYLEETTTAALQVGQTVHLSPTLTALGSTNEIRIGGKLKKMFGGTGDTAGMGAVSVKTQPKGAAVAINNRILDKNSPVDFSLNPGAYVVDITLSGFKSVHKVINVDKSGKVVVDEILERE